MSQSTGLYCGKVDLDQINVELITWILIAPWSRLISSLIDTKFKKFNAFNAFQYTIRSTPVSSINSVHTISPLDHDEGQEVLGIVMPFNHAVGKMFLTLIEGHANTLCGLLFLTHYQHAYFQTWPWASLCPRKGPSAQVQ